MPLVLTRNAILMCSHGGTVVVPPLPGRVTIDGAAVLCMGDLFGATIAACPQAGPGIKPCTTVGVCTPDSCSQKVLIDGRAVHLDTFQALTDGAPPGTVTVRFAGQTKVQG